MWKTQDTWRIVGVYKIDLLLKQVERKLAFLLPSLMSIPNENFIIIIMFYGYFLEIYIGMLS